MPTSKEKRPGPLKSRGKASSQVEHHQFQHVDVQASRENVLVAAVAIVPARARVPRGVRSLRITSRRSAPRSRSPQRSTASTASSRGDQGDADARTGTQHACIDHLTSLDQPGLSVPSGLLRSKGGPELADKCELVLSPDERAVSPPRIYLV